MGQFSGVVRKINQVGFTRIACGRKDFYLLCKFFGYRVPKQVKEWIVRKHLT